MYKQYREKMCCQFNESRDYFIKNPEKLIALEEFITNTIEQHIMDNLSDFISDYNEASYLYPFWANYSPEERGRQPVGDQTPWIEVGEHAIGHKISRLMAKDFTIREIGLPSGADDRFLIQDSEIKKITGFTDQAMLFLDIKSVGPRDDAEHTVISPYQVSGDGVWNNPESNLVNSVMMATGARATHEFYPAISPIYVLSTGTIAPTIHIFIKPVYKMLHLETPEHHGQPLKRIKLISLPNGLLLTMNPNYLKNYQGLFFPGKDDKSKATNKVRCRVSFQILKKLNEWRIKVIDV